MNHLENFAAITTFLFDVDGVLTDSHVLVLEDGKLLRRMSVRDGYAIKRALQAGYRVGIITGGKSEGVRERLFNLGITDIYSGVEDKMESYEEFIDLYELQEEQILYMGDDMPDYPILRRVGLPTCPGDACPEVKSVSQYISPLAGGAGCVRDVIEKVLRIRGDWAVSPAERPSEEDFLE